MNDIDRVTKAIHITNNPLSENSRFRLSPRQRISPSPEPHPITTSAIHHLLPVDSSHSSQSVTATDRQSKQTRPATSSVIVTKSSSELGQTIMTTNQLLAPNMLSQQKLGLSDSLNNASSDADVPPSNFSYRKNLSASDLDPWERRKQAALVKAEAKLEKAQRLHRVAQQSVEQNVADFLRVKTIPGVSSELKTANVPYDKRITKLQDTCKELERKIADYQLDIARIQSGDIPKRYATKDILSTLKSKVSNENLEHTSANDTSTATVTEHATSSHTLDVDNPSTSTNSNATTGNSNSNNQNLLTLSQNSNTLDVFRSSPSSSISNEIGNSQFYIDLNSDLSAAHDLDKSPSTKRRLTDHSNAESNDRISDYSSDERLVSQNTSKRNTMSTIEYHQLTLKIESMQKTIDRYDAKMTEFQKQIDSLTVLTESQREQSRQLSLLTELHQDEIPIMKNDLKKLEHKLVYNFNECWAEMAEKLDKLDTRTIKVEQTQAYSLETEENTHRLISKFVNILLTVFAIILLLLSTIKNLVQSRVHAVILLILVFTWIGFHYLPENYFERSYFRDLPSIFKRTS